MRDTKETEVPRKPGRCEYCRRLTTVYAYVLWVCRRCLDSDPNRGTETCLGCQLPENHCCCGTL